VIERDDFDRQVAAWLADDARADAGDGAPTVLSAVVGRVGRTRQRPAWVAGPPWSSMDRILRRLDVAPALLVVVLLGLLLVAVVAVAVVGSHQPRLARPIGLPVPLPPPVRPSVPPSPSPQRWPETARATQLEFNGTDFYTVPRPLTSSEPGELVYVERMGDPADGRLYRVLYHSRSVTDRDVAVSGTIWIPASPPPPGGYPIVTFAMADDGSGDTCAMSRSYANGIDASYGGLMSLFLDEGYVVAYTDYEGLGTSDPYPFGVLDSAAHAMLDAARAGRELLGSAASDRIVLVGDGFFGGDAATRGGERAAHYAPDLDVRGVIAADAGGGDGEAALRDLISAGPSGRVSGLLQAIAGFSVAYPELQPEEILTPLGLDDLRLVDTTCWTQLHDAVDRHPVGDVLSVNPLDVPGWAARIASMKIVTAPYPTLLMASGPLESAANLDATAALFCHGNDAILLRAYPEAHIDARDVGKDPRQGVFVIGWPDMRPWIEDRFAGVPATGNCDR
jgi:hypothetical protein